ncbi:MAG TPA: FeoA family protein [Labilithrix sp.]|nr:FeoA family protein [Labilithrix sp.]
MTAMLADAVTGERLRIARVDLDSEAAAWIGAVGLSEGEELVVLRRAALGGPLHVRTSSGGEFAVGREVARHITVLSVKTRAPDPGDR